MNSHDKVVYFSYDLVSRIHYDDKTAYMSHYSLTQLNAVKTSLLMDDPLKQHNNFVFFYLFQNSYSSKVESSDKLSEELHHLINADYVIDPQTQMKWSNKQLQLYLHIPDVKKLPNCLFYYEHNQWYGTDKCHTHYYQYEIKNGEIFLLSKKIEIF